MLFTQVVHSQRDSFSLPFWHFVEPPSGTSAPLVFIVGHCSLSDSLLLSICVLRIVSMQIDSKSESDREQWPTHQSHASGDQKARSHRTQDTKATPVAKNENEFCLLLLQKTKTKFVSLSGQVLSPGLCCGCGYGCSFDSDCGWRRPSSHRREDLPRLKRS